MNAHRSIQQYLDDQHGLLALGLDALTRSLIARDFFDAGQRLAGFGAHLRRYVRGEERVLFPVYARLPTVRPEPIARMRAEHGDLRAMVSSIAALIEQKDAPRGLVALGALDSVLVVHSLKEDWLVYPAVVDAVPTAEQDELVRALRDGPRLVA